MAMIIPYTGRMTDELLTTEQAAARLGVTDQAIRKLINRGRLPARKFGPVWMIRETDLDSVKDRRRGKTPKGKIDS